MPQQQAGVSRLHRTVTPCVRTCRGAARVPAVTLHACMHVQTVVVWAWHGLACRAMFKSMSAAASIPHFHLCDELALDQVRVRRAGHACCGGERRGAGGGGARENGRISQISQGLHLHLHTRCCCVLPTLCLRGNLPALHGLC